MKTDKKILRFQNIRIHEDGFVVMQLTAKIYTEKRVMHVKSYCFDNLNLLLFAVFVAVAKALYYMGLCHTLAILSRETKESFVLPV